MKEVKLLLIARKKHKESLFSKHPDFCTDEAMEELRQIDIILGWIDASERWKDYDGGFEG